MGLSLVAGETMFHTYLRGVVPARVIESFGVFSPGDTVPVNRVVRSEAGDFIGVRGYEEPLLPLEVIDEVNRNLILEQSEKIKKGQ